MTRGNSPQQGATFSNGTNRMVSLADFHTFVRPLVGDISSPVLDHALQESIRWFCDDSRVLVDETTIFFQKGVRDYDLQIPEHQYLIAPELLPWWNRNGRTQRGSSPTDAYYGDIFGFGSTNYTVLRDGPNNVIEFENEPTREGARQFHYSWAPQRDFCEVPALLYDMWMLPIKYRAASEVLLLPGEKFSSMRKSQQFAEMAHKGLERARRWKAQNYSQQPRKMFVRPFLRGSRSPKSSYGYGGVADGFGNGGGFY